MKRYVILVVLFFQSTIALCSVKIEASDADIFEIVYNADQVSLGLKNVSKKVIIVPDFINYSEYEPPLQSHKSVCVAGGLPDYIPYKILLPGESKEFLLDIGGIVGNYKYEIYYLDDLQKKPKTIKISISISKIQEVIAFVGSPKYWDLLKEYFKINDSKNIRHSEQKKLEKMTESKKM